MLNKGDNFMIIGIPKEIKELENRVSITPSGVNTLVNSGHIVYIEKDAGLKSGFPDNSYEKSGATILSSAKEVWEKSNLVLKVKEPLEEEFKYFRDDLTIFTYLHLASNMELTKALLESKTTAIAYETIALDNNTLPLLTPMSEIAGKVAVQHGATYLESHYGGKGKLLDGAPGVPPAHVVIVGGGIVGTAAIKRAIGLGARVTVLDINVDRLRYLGDLFYGKIETLLSNEYNIKNALKSADLVISAVLIPGSKAPKLIKEYMVKEMEEGSVIVDVAIDQGGCVETIDRPTTIENPVFIKHGVIHSAIANIPSSFCQTATSILANTSIPYVLKLANLGTLEAIKLSSPLKKGVNIYNGNITNIEVAKSLDLNNLYKNIDIFL